MPLKALGHISCQAHVEAIGIGFAAKHVHQIAIGHALQQARSGPSAFARCASFGETSFVGWLLARCRTLRGCAASASRAEARPKGERRMAGRQGDARNVWRPMANGRCFWLTHSDSAS